MEVDFSMPVAIWVTMLLICAGLFLVASGFYTRELWRTRLNWWRWLLLTLPMLISVNWCIKVCVDVLFWYRYYQPIAGSLPYLNGSPGFWLWMATYLNNYTLPIYTLSLGLFSLLALLTSYSLRLKQTRQQEEITRLYKTRDAPF